MANLSGLWKDGEGNTYTILDGSKDTDVNEQGVPGEVGRLVYIWKPDKTTMKDWEIILQIEGVMRNRESVIFLAYYAPTKDGAIAQCRFYIPGEMRKYMKGGSRHDPEFMYKTTTPEDEYKWRP